MKNKTKNLMPLLLIGIIPFSNLFYWALNNSSRGVYDVTTDLDRALPFLEIFIIPYMTLWFFLAFCFVYLCFKNREVYYKSMITLSICFVIAFITYYFFQTTVARPEVTGNNIFSKLVKFTYGSDEPYNCMPSIHVITAYIAMKGMNLTKTSKFITYFTNIQGALIIVSTQFVKQHVILDIFSALFICDMTFKFVVYMDKKGFVSWFKKVFLSFNMKKNFENSYKN